MKIDDIRAEVNRAQKEEFLALLRSTERDGIENLIDYLEKAMADYVENQDRIRHISTHDWRFRK